MNYYFGEKSNLKKAIFFMILSTFLFAIDSVLVKSLSEYPLIIISFFRHFPAVILIPIFLRLQKKKIFIRNKPIVLLRSILGFISTLGFFYAYIKLNLADATAIGKLSPFFVILLSRFFLKEKISFRQIIILIIVLLGTVLIIKPGFNFQIFPLLVCIVSAILQAGGHVTLRILRFTDDPISIVYYLSLFSFTISLIFILLQKTFIPIDGIVFLRLLLIGVIGLISQYFLTMSYRLAPAKLVSLYLYLQIVFGVLLGIIFFKELPDILSSIGILIILLCGYLNYYFKEEIV